MKWVHVYFAIVSLAVVLLASVGWAEDTAPKGGNADINKICPISGKPADPKITVVYEGKTYAFAEEACRTKFNADREKSLYH